MTKVADFLAKNAENPIPISEIEQQDPFAPAGETKKIPKPLASANLEDAGFPKWAVTWVNGLSQKDLFDYAEVSFFATNQSSLALGMALNLHKPYGSFLLLFQMFGECLCMLLHVVFEPAGRGVLANLHQVLQSVFFSWATDLYDGIGILSCPYCVSSLKCFANVHVFEFLDAQWHYFRSLSDRCALEYIYVRCVYCDVFFSHSA